MADDRFFNSESEAAADAVRRYGARSEALTCLTEEMRKNNILVNNSFQIFPRKDQKQTAFRILADFYGQDLSDENDRSCILYALIKLNIRKEEICELIFSEISRADCFSERFIWELCDMLYELKQKKYKDEYIAIARRTSLGAGRQMIFLLMGKLKDECYLPVILESLDDDTVNGHALSALSAYKDEKYDIYFSGFINDKRRWVREIAEKRLK